MEDENRNGATPEKRNSPEQKDTYYLKLQNSCKKVIGDAFKSGLGKVALYIEATTGKISQIHPLLIKKELNAATTKPSNIEEVRFTRTGKLLVWIKEKNTAIQLLKLEKIGQQSVQVGILYSSIQCKYILRNIPGDISLEDICTELEETGQTILSLRRFTHFDKPTKKRTPSSVVLINCVGDKPPQFVKMWYNRYPTWEYIPSPWICMKCLKYGHRATSCRESQHCKACGSEACDESCSGKPFQCPGCDDQHPFKSKQCPQYKKELQILCLQQQKRIAYGEAKKIITQNVQGNYAKATQINTSIPKTYSEAVATLKHSVAKIETRQDQIEQQLKVILENVMKIQMYASMSEQSQNATDLQTKATDSQPTTSNRSQDKPKSSNKSKKQRK